jgi:hypothetical protein
VKRLILDRRQPLERRAVAVGAEVLEEPPRDVDQSARSLISFA